MFIFHLSSFALMARASHSELHSAHRGDTTSKSRAADSVRATRAIAIDTGGTFTDCVWVEGGALKTLKVFSTPDDPSRAIAEALRKIGEAGRKNRTGAALTLLHMKRSMVIRSVGIPAFRALTLSPPMARIQLP